MSRHWTESETQYLQRFAATKRLSDLAQRFDTSEDEIRARLQELGLAAKDLPSVSTAPPELGRFEAGVQALYAQRWAEAARCFEDVIAAGETVELAGRARQFLAICRARLEAATADHGDPYLVAVYHKNRGDLAGALTALGGAAEDDRTLYLEAAVHALEDRATEAAQALSRAIALNPHNRVHAFHDSDFAALRERQEYAHLFGLG